MGAGLHSEMWLSDGGGGILTGVDGVSTLPWWSWG
jgi:hypothetical protein